MGALGCELGFGEREIPGFMSSNVFGENRFGFAEEQMTEKEWNWREVSEEEEEERKRKVDIVEIFFIFHKTKRELGRLSHV